MPAPILPKSLKKFTLVDIDPLELARQITDIEHNLYKVLFLFFIIYLFTLFHS